MKYILLLLACLLLFIVFDDAYSSVYFATVLILGFFAFDSKNINQRVISIFLLLYFSISLIPGSTYRGEVSLYTIQLYSIMCVLPCILFLFSRKKDKGITQQFLGVNAKLYKFYIYHLIVVYAALMVIIAKNGMVIINQESRFGIDSTISYVVKSSIYFPLIFYVAKKGKHSREDILLYYIAPLFPALFIGSRGTVIMILFSILIVRFTRIENIKNKFQAYVQKIKSRRILVIAGILSFLIIVGFSYVRRSHSEFLVSTDQLLIKYFNSTNIFLYIFAPFHFALREQIGISNYIVDRGLTGTLPYPMFIADLITVLPGSQPAAGITLNLMMTNNDHAGLTPGLLGALYIDIRAFAVFGVLVGTIIMRFLYKKALKSEIWLIYYSLTVVQFFHIFHRGFLKPEYFFAYIIVHFYVIHLSKYKRKYAQ